MQLHFYFPRPFEARTTFIEDAGEALVDPVLIRPDEVVRVVHLVVKSERIGIEKKYILQVSGKTGDVRLTKFRRVKSSFDNTEIGLKEKPAEAALEAVMK
jgi:hypothetical protein